MESAIIAKVHSRSSISRLTMRTVTRLYRLPALTFSPAKVPSRVIFIHIPRCGGMTIREHIKWCLGGRKRGHMVQANEIFLDQVPDQQKIEKARRARFVTGHYSWATLERIGRGQGDFAFTFLREPRQRLLSFHHLMTNPSDRHKPKELHARVALCWEMSPVDMFTTGNLDLRQMLDNYMVRQLSCGLTEYPVEPHRWPELLERAKRNLASLDYVGFHDRYADDFVQLLSRTQLPLIGPVPHLNDVKHTRPPGRRGRLRALMNDPEVSAALGPLTYWDAQLYDFARRFRLRALNGTDATADMREPGFSEPVQHCARAEHCRTTS